MYKLCTPVFNCLHGVAPVYLSCRPCANQSPRISAHYGTRSFAAAGTSTWISLPALLCERLSILLSPTEVNIKTFLFISTLVTIMPNTHRRRRRDETVLSRRRRRCEHNSQLAHDDWRRIRSTIWKLTKQTPWPLITPVLIDIGNFFNNDVIMSSLLKKLSNIYQNSRSQTAMESGQFPHY